jgi:hypothetical protein
LTSSTFLVSSKGNIGFSESHNISLFSTGCRGYFEWRYIKNDQMRTYSLAEQDFNITKFSKFDHEIYSQKASFPLIPNTSILIKVSVSIFNSVLSRVPSFPEHQQI